MSLFLLVTLVDLGYEVCLSPCPLAGLVLVAMARDARLRLLLGNPKSRFGLIVIIVDAAGRRSSRRWIATHDPTPTRCLTPSRARRGTTSSARPTRARTSSRRSSGVRAPPCSSGPPRRPLATALAATLGVLGAYAAAGSTTLVNFAINVFLVIPTIPLLVVVSAYLKSQGSISMILILGSPSGRSRRASCARRRSTLRNRDFILAAQGRGRVDAGGSSSSS